MRGRPVVPPISASIVQSFDSYEALAETHQRRFDRQRYGRDSSEIVLDVEHTIEKMTGKRYRALLFGSGMSAIAALLDVLVGDRMVYVPNEHYRKLKELTGARWATTEYRDVREVDPDGPAVVWVESPSNPHLRVADYAHLEALRRKHPEIRIVADLTLAGLGNFRGPFWLLDAEVHSCTKYAGGHNDIMAGAALVNPRHYPALWERRSFAGGILDPWQAWLLGRSLKTYELRMARQVENTDAVLAWLRQHVPPEHIYYPSRSDLDGYHEHGGAVIAFRAGCDDMVALTDRAARLDTIRMAPNFGSVDTLIEVPGTMSHYGKGSAELERAGIEPDLVRLAVGIEPVATIIRDLQMLLCVAA